MNKGLAAHIVVTIAYALCILYIVNGEGTTIKERLLIVLVGFFINITTGVLCDKWYDQKIN